MKIFLAFLVGILSSATVGWVIYKRQKKEAGDTEGKLIALLEKQIQRSDCLYGTMCDFTQNQGNLLEDVASLKDDFERFFGEISQQEKLLPSQAQATLARAIADRSVKSILSDAPSSGSLSTDLLQELHKDIFPKGYRPAGKIRDARVWIGLPGSKPDGARYVPPPPEEIMPRLEELLNNWNSSFESLKKASLGVKLKRVAEFHHRFVSIHPFLDGNGMLARLLLAMQLRDLTGELIDVETTRPEYYEAVHLADKADISNLIDYIRSLLP
jgi:fido (protein-threonine AMPylation protein)